MSGRQAAKIYPFVRDPGGVDPSNMIVDVGSPGLPTTLEGARITDLANGDVEVDFGEGGDYSRPARDPSESTRFDDNLAEFIDEAELGRIALDICDAVQADLHSRKRWLDRFQKGMELLGVNEPSANLGALRHAKEISHPVIAEALVQYQARAITEHFPPEGPVKTIVLGKTTPEREEQADRVGGYMNYQLMVQDRAYFHETDQGYFIQGMEGSIFKKVYRDELRQRNVSRMVLARDFIVPYSATSLDTAPRYTHILPYTQNDVLKLQQNGYYRKCTLDIPTGDVDEHHGAAKRAQDDLEGKDPTDEIEEDREHTIYEQHTDLDLKGFEDTGDDGEPTEIKLPYIVHVDRDSQKVLAIYRNWREHDQLKEKRVRFAHYKFLPGPGFYGMGLVHVLGGLGAAATGILRLLLVGSAFASMGGGFKTKDAKISGSVELEPGVFKDTEHTYEELSKLFYQPVFNPPNESLFKTLGLIVEASKSFSSTTEAMTGEGPATGPVGTMVALIEQGSKVYSGIHKRSHMAAGDEYRMLAELNFEYLPPEGYPYDVPGATRQVFADDFDDRVDVQPVSDPNIFSATQRIAVAQTLLQLAKENPDVVDRVEACRRLISALRTPDAENIIIDKMKVERADPISENAMLMVGRPIRVFPDQDHASHMAVVGSLLQDKATPENVKATAAAHYAEHQAMQWMVQAGQAIGMPLQLNLDAPAGKPVAMKLPPQVENQVAQRAAAVINKLKPPQPDADALKAQGQAQAASAKVQGDLALKQQREAGMLKIKEGTERARMALEGRRAQARAQLDAAQGKLKVQLERELGFARLAIERELGIAKLRQQGQNDEAQRQQDALQTERTAMSGDTAKAGTDVEDAINRLADGMDAVVSIVENAMKASAAAEQGQQEENADGGQPA